MPERGRHRAGTGRARKHVAEVEPPPDAEVSPGPRSRRRRRAGPSAGLTTESPRRAALAERRRERRRRAVLGGAGMIIGAGFVGLLAAGVFLASRTSPRPGNESPPPEPAAGAPITTTLLIGTRQGRSGSEDDVVWLTLLSHDRDEGTGSVVYLPAHTAAEVPGRGLMGVGEALASGGVPLLLVSTETLLGLPIDHYVELSDSDARSLFAAVGDVSVDVPAEVRVGAGKNQTRLLFSEGDQRLSAEFLADLLYTLGVDGDDAELGGRHLAFWEGLLGQFENDPDELAGRVEEAAGALVESDTPAEELGSLVAALAGLADGDRRVATLPVEQVSVGGDELYQTDSSGLASWLDDTVGSRTVDTDEVRIQILNGNGVPGIGQQVAATLGGAEYRLILGGNAPRLDYRRTQIVTYDDSPAGIAIANRIAEVLGVGEVKTSGVGQDIVDVTIVVGKDFLR